MTVTDFKPVLLEKSLGRTDISLPEETKLFERIHVALKRIAKDTLPLSLVEIVNIENGEIVAVDILRRVDEKTFVRMPNKPTSFANEIDIDEALIDAVAYFVMAGLERVNANTHMGMYHGEIDMNNDRLMETALTDASNDEERNYVFP